MAKRLTKEERDMLAANKLLEQIDKATRTNRLKHEYWEAMSKEEFRECCAYRVKPSGRPYPWQVEFHNAGRDFKDRAIIANNQGGKTRTCGAEVAMHATGLYPPWWEGHRFDTPPKICIGSQTNDTLRDPQQIELFGHFQSESNTPDGTGWISKNCIGKPSFRQCGISGVFDEIPIKHASGGTSLIKQKSYEQGWTKWQGTQFDLYWLDEEPENDDKIFSEIVRGIMTRGGMILLSRTPLFGMTKAVSYFMQSDNKHTYYKNVTLDDSPHLTPDAKKKFIAGLMPHEVECRTRGIPMLGEGAIYPVSDDVLSIEPFRIPEHYRQIVGLDFGHSDGASGHYTAAIRAAYDPDDDVIYLISEYRGKGPIAVHAEKIRSWGSWIPASWPHDGMQKDRTGYGLQLSKVYGSNGLNMLSVSARYDDKKGGGQAREPIIQECFERMVSGRLKVFSHLNAWFEEKRMYHRKDGKVVDTNDDLISAMHYAVMMIRYARSYYTQPYQAMTDSGSPLQEFTYA